MEACLQGGEYQAKEILDRIRTQDLQRIIMVLTAC